jgi:curved DNA-binding protein CbpA
MREPGFRGDPYRELGLAHDASGSAIKRRWRELAREHHPDRAAGNREEADRLTGRMARINAAYDLLRDPLRRATYDQSGPGRRARERGRGQGGTGRTFEEGPTETPSGPPPPPRTRPVTGRFDTSAAFRPRNATLTEALSGWGQRTTYAGAAPRPAPRARHEGQDLRASTPTGPVVRQRTARSGPLPSLREARETVLEFGKHRGYTLGQVEVLEPTYIDWIAQTITRDRELVQMARLIQSEMDRQGIARRVRQGATGPGNRAAEG